MNRTIPSVILTLAAIGLLLGAAVLPAQAQAAASDLSYDCSAQADIPPAECMALGALYASTNGPAWANSTGWLAGPPCAWYGVQCSEGHVTNIDLADNQLDGSIPLDLADLAGLQSLDLSGNQITGSIPAQLGSLSGLQVLYLESNQLSGSIPPELGSLGQLQYLYLYSNQLSGSIPAELGKLGGLSILLISSNQLSGGIPVELASLAQLEILNLSGNQLSGSIPAELGDLAGLRSLDLSANPEFRGALPKSLTRLALDYFNFEDTGLCEPADADFQAWLAKIPPLDRVDVVCPVEMPWPLWLPVILR